MNTVMMTVSEHEQELERCAVARFICKVGRVPSRVECSIELKLMEQENIRPKPQESVCAQWLRERGVPVPGRDVNAARQMPPAKPTASAALATATATPTARPVALAAVERGAPVAAALPAQAVAAVPRSKRGTVVEQLMESEARAGKAEATLKRLGLDKVI
jgi:hypothetical protein